MFRIPLVTLLMMSLLAGCSFKPLVGPPWMHKLLYESPNGPAMFQAGWRDGCETGISASANHFQKHFYSFKQDYKSAQDPTYYTGWRVAFQYCQRYVFQYAAREYF